ncbi:MAG: c-type cytochrome domain-containing protein, partial [Rubripirellula sp.]
MKLVRSWKCAPLVLCSLLIAVACCASAADSVLGHEELSQEQTEFFEAKVRPLLIDACYECHSVETGDASGELLIDSAAGVLKGGLHGKLVVPGNPDKSLLMRVVGYRDRQLQMPPDEKLNDESIAILRKWIEMGAPDPRVESTIQSLKKKATP